MLLIRANRKSIDLDERFAWMSFSNQQAPHEKFKGKSNIIIMYGLLTLTAGLWYGQCEMSIDYY